MRTINQEMDSLEASLKAEIIELRKRLGKIETALAAMDIKSVSIHEVAKRPDSTFKATVKHGKRIRRRAT